MDSKGVLGGGIYLLDARDGCMLDISSSSTENAHRGAFLEILVPPRDFFSVHSLLFFGAAFFFCFFFHKAYFCIRL